MDNKCIQWLKNEIEECPHVLLSIEGLLRYLEKKYDKSEANDWNPNCKDCDPDYPNCDKCLGS